MMKIEFNKIGAERKALVTTIGEILNVTPRYMGMPSTAYEIDYFIVTKTGALEFDDRADSEEIENLLERLADKGFIAANNEIPAEIEKEPQEANTGLTVAMPLEKVKVGNLTNLLEAKGSLIKKALGISQLPIEISEEQILFPWFEKLPNADTIKIYTNFIAALCKMSKEQQRISCKEKQVENEKYSFRCFLIRLGFVGEKYKADRKVLLKNLKGSSAFKNGGADYEVSE